MKQSRSLARATTGAIILVLVCGTPFAPLSLLRRAAANDACLQPPAGMIGWWPGDGNASDLVNGNNGTLQDGAAFAPGMVDQAFTFDGRGDSVNVPKSADLDACEQVTIDFWMKGDPSNPLNNCCQGLVTTDYYGVEISSGGQTPNHGVNFFVNTVGPLDFSHTSDANGGSPVVSAGEWHHVAGTYDGTKLQLYIDGLPWGNPTLRSGVIRPMGPTSFLSIGSEDGRRAFSPGCCSGRYFNGLIDEVEIFARALSQEEIQSIFLAGRAGKCKVNPVPASACGVIPVAIDIKPGSFPNSINLGSSGTVPVAIFSTPTFDARTVDPATITLASAPVKLKGQGTPMASFQDVNHDGLLDLVVHVSTEALELSESDTEAVLQGKTFAGASVRGTDSVRIVP